MPLACSDQWDNYCSSFLLTFYAASRFRYRHPAGRGQKNNAQGSAAEASGKDKRRKNNQVLAIPFSLVRVPNRAGERAIERWSKRKKESDPPGPAKKVVAVLDVLNLRSSVDCNGQCLGKPTIPWPLSVPGPSSCLFVCLFVCFCRSLC